MHSLPCGSWEEEFLKVFNAFSLNSNNLPLEKGMAFHLNPSTTHLNPLYQSIHSAKFNWDWPCDSGDFFKVYTIILLFCYYLPLEKDVALHLNRFESTSPKDYAKFGWNWPTGSGEKDF